MRNMPVHCLPRMRRVFLAAVLQGFAGLTQAQSILLQSTNHVSQRSAFLEDDGNVAYLYLSAPSMPIPVRAVVVYSRHSPQPKIDWSAVSKSGEQPPLSRDIASITAVLAQPKAAEFSFKWSRKGNAVALLHKGTPLALAAASETDGYSKAVSKPSPLAVPWDQRVYESTVGK